MAVRRISRSPVIGRPAPHSETRLIPEILSRRLTVEEGVHVLIICLFAMEGIFSIVPGRFVDIASHISILLFWISAFFSFFTNRGRIHWELWTCRCAAVYLAWNLLSVTWTTVPLSTSYSPAISCVAVFLYFNYVLDRFTPAQFLRLLMWAFTILFVTSLIVIRFAPWNGITNLGNDSSPENIGAWKGVFKQKNEMGLNCAIAIGLCLGLKPKTNMERLWRWGMVLLALGLDYKAQSRESWISVAALFTIAPFVKAIGKLNARSRIPTTILLAIFATVAITLLYLNMGTILALLGRDKTLSGRSTIWDATMLMIRRKPLLGYGIYGLWGTSTAWDIIVRAGWHPTSSHSSYLDTIVSYGIIGFILFLPIPVFAFAYLFRAVVSYMLNDIEPFIYITLAILIISFVMGVLTYSPGIGMVLLLYSVANLEKVERSGFMSLDGFRRA